MSLKSIVMMSVAAVALACGPSKPGETQNPNQQTPDQQAPEFEGGGQQSNIGEPLYPGPYGIGVGSVIPNYHFFGYPRGPGTGTVDPTQFQKIQLSDFYNPTGTEVFPAGSPYGEGTPKPKALILDRSAVWCPPCKYEAQTIIPPRRAQYFPDGEFLVTLDDGPNPGTVATQKDLNEWVEGFNVDYTAVIDPNSTLSAIVGVEAYPGNVIVRTRDMKIIEEIAGTPDAAFWSLFEKVIAGQPVLPSDQ